MRRNTLRLRGALAIGALAVASALTGAGAGAKAGAAGAKVEQTIGNLAEVSGSEIRVEGVGLVIGLDNTGSDPPPSAERQKLIDEMRKAKVEGADKILASTRVSLVIVKARIPAGISPKDRLDVDVTLPTASTTTSLAGGRLLETRLTEVAIAGGEQRQGKSLAIAGGPVMTGSDARPDDPKVGRVLGGGRVRNEVPYLLLIHEKNQTVRTAAQIEAVIKQRFHQREGVDEKGMATSKSDKHLVLKVPKVYHQNQARYFQIIKLLPMVDTPELRTERLARWGKELLDPKQAGVAALRLEGLGKNAIEVLKTGLAAPDSQARFFAAEALAYLDDPSGVDVLARTATQLPEFRAHALAALAAMDHPASTLRLRQLMAEPDPQVRYGAFNALRTLDEHDPFLGQVRVLEEPPEPADEPMALAIGEAPPRRRRPPRPEDPFSLYIVDCEGPPLIHVAKSRRCEVVIFGKGQKLLTPVVLGGTGAILLNAAEGDSQVQISRIDSRGLDAPDVKVSSPLELGEVIRESAQLGATYPEILAILRAAERQKNLPGPLKVDAAPTTGDRYQQAQLAGVGSASKSDDAVAPAKFESKPRRATLMDRWRRRGGKPR